MPKNMVSNKKTPNAEGLGIFFCCCCIFIRGNCNEILNMQCLEWKGFEQGVIACCGHGGKYNFNNTERCGATKRVNGTEIVIANSCKDPSVRIIWDGIHYTEAANKWIFQQIVNGSFSDPPHSLKRACYGKSIRRHKFQLL